MGYAYPFYSVNEVLKPVQKRVHHNNTACRPGQDIPPTERRPGTKLRFKPKFSFEVVVDEVPRMVKLQDVALAMGLSVSGIRERFENHFGVKR